MLPALGSTSCDISHETGATNCCGHWILRLVISHTRQAVRFVTGIGICVLCYHPRNRGYESCDITHETGGYDLLRTLGSAPCDITYETRGYDSLRALGSASSVITHEPGGTICYGHWVLRLVTSHMKEGVRVVLVKKFCVLCCFT